MYIRDTRGAQSKSGRARTLHPGTTKSTKTGEAIGEQLIPNQNLRRVMEDHLDKAKEKKRQGGGE
jgi:hypothetical protein